MEQIINEQTELKTHTVETEKDLGDKKSEVSFGKFKDVDSLVNAYNSLQSEFTKRCQKIKELESKIAEGQQKTADHQVDEKIQTDKNEPSNIGENSVDKEDVLKEYLLDVLNKKPQAIVMDGAGAGVKTPVSRPKTIEEAGNLAKKLLVNN
ncbi:MAG: hypothetical protein E7348_00185 [Clostridiales bacterium]|nr:hypothetical protein [Clostridiales bacterium]